MASTVVGNVECFGLIGQFSLCEKKIMYKLGCKIIIRKLKERQNYVFIDYEDIM